MVANSLYAKNFMSNLCKIKHFVDFQREIGVFQHLTGNPNFIRSPEKSSWNTRNICAQLLTFSSIVRLNFNQFKQNKYKIGEILRRKQ